MAVLNIVELEKGVLKQWKDEDVFRKILDKEAPKGDFVFFEGPPTANGMPHIGHVETRAFKDLIPRYKTMQGFHVVRKAGWDTQGLPVELEVEKAIGVSGKKDIEKYGIAKFNEECQKNVWKYKDLWERMTERIGFWIDMEHPYITYTNDYIETLWWILKKAWDAGLFVQDYKVVPFCPRCGTALSSHEVAQGYERVKDRAVYLKFELVDEPGTFILAWTTTPWTLPGNVALAIDPNIDYVKAKFSSGECIIVASSRLAEVAKGKMRLGGVLSKGAPDGLALTIVWRKKGSELVGKQYKPLFDFLDLGKETGKKSYYITAADFVTTEEGTGVVHTAVMYGEDDFNLGQKLDLPKKHTVDETGKFNELVKPWQGKYVKDKAVEDGIVKYLQDNGKLYKEELYEHDYPFCWRCKSPLLYYAKTSWFITMSKLRDELIANNEKINWVPKHIKDGRFGEWLREVKDWAISRERYWGTPLPIWRCIACDHRECIGSYKELLSKMPVRNRIILVRHGEATISVHDLINTDITKNSDIVLTKKGISQAKKTAKKLKKAHIDAVYSSEFVRTKQTADIIAAECGVTVTTDSRLDEYQIGPKFEGKTTKEYHEFLPHVSRFHEMPEGATETWFDVRKRFMGFLREIDAKYEGKTIVVVSHCDPILVALWAASIKAESQINEIEYPSFAEPIEVRFPASVFRPDGSFDPHRPFIDSISYPCPKCRSTMMRVPEVADTWFDSGSMPFAQRHYPFERKDMIDAGKAYPAAFISEAIDQTRGWFYTLLAIATFLQKAGAVKDGPPYETCVVLGHIRDREGKKLSKSLGNYIDPMVLLDKYGADAVRMYLFTINQPSEPKNFDESQLSEVVKKHFMILWNVLSFWRLHTKGSAPVDRPESEDVMDRWVLSLLDKTTATVTDALEGYRIVDAARELVSFVTDLSTWYVRRSRERAKGAGRAAVAGTLGYVLREYAKLAAPFTPFFTDALWRSLGAAASVHLEQWPQPEEIHNELLVNMARARNVVETGHALRASAKLKVRQPLSQLVVTQEFRNTIIGILKDELNVKQIVAMKKLPEGGEWVSLNGVALDKTVTDELREEGYLREMVRAVNALRKELRLKPGEPLAARFKVDDDIVLYVQHFKKTLKEKGSLSALNRADDVGEPVVVAELDGRKVLFGRA
ncbi:MAG: class I tRNA ligase family protein [Candidatus Kerfeldbacteria bacterium]